MDLSIAETTTPLPFRPAAPGTASMLLEVELVVAFDVSRASSISASPSPSLYTSPIIDTCSIMCTGTDAATNESEPPCMISRAPIDSSSSATALLFLAAVWSGSTPSPLSLLTMIRTS